MLERTHTLMRVFMRSARTLKELVWSLNCLINLVVTRVFGARGQSGPHDPEFDCQVGQSVIAVFHQQFLSNILAFGKLTVWSRTVGLSSALSHVVSDCVPFNRIVSVSEERVHLYLVLYCMSVAFCLVLFSLFS